MVLGDDLLMFGDDLLVFTVGESSWDSGESLDEVKLVVWSNGGLLRFVIVHYDLYFRIKL